MFVRRWSATTWVSSPSPTSPSSMVARAWWARTRSSCRWSESIAQHRKIWLRGEVDKKCKLHLIWFATDWSVKLPAFRRNFQTHVWTHVESQNTNHGVDHRDLSMFLYVFINCLKLWAHCRFWNGRPWNGRPHSEVPSHCQTWHLFIRRRQCCCHSSNLITRVHLAIAELAWDFMILDLLCIIYTFFLFRRWHIMDSDGAWWCSAERFSCLLGETQLHADRGTRTFDSERSWWQPCWPTTSIMNITSINSTTLTLAHC